jgi:clan AA aspartic protease
MLSITIRDLSRAQSTCLDAWIDTGFTGHLVLPRSYIALLKMQPTAQAVAVLADGSQTTVDTYSCLIDWFGKETAAEVIANDGHHALLGVVLLLDHVLTINYPASTLNLV